MNAHEVMEKYVELKRHQQALLVQQENTASMLKALCAEVARRIKRAHLTLKELAEINRIQAIILAKDCGICPNTKESHRRVKKLLDPRDVAILGGDPSL